MKTRKSESHRGRNDPANWDCPANWEDREPREPNRELGPAAAAAAAGANWDATANWEDSNFEKIQKNKSETANWDHFCFSEFFH